MKTGKNIIIEYNDQFEELDDNFVNLSDMIDAAIREAYIEGRKDALESAVIEEGQLAVSGA